MGIDTPAGTGILAELRPIFYPRGIAIVGASRDPRKMSYCWVRGLLRSGFAGGVFPVNPKETEVLEQRCYPSVRDIPGPVDLAIVCVPRALAISVVEDCAAKGVKGVHFFTGGFRETGQPEDLALEERVVAAARENGIRVIGPNCIGIYNPEARIPWGPSDLVGEPGHTGLMSQSGGHAGKMAELGLNNGLRFSKVISYGNGADLGAVEFLQYLGSDPSTRAVGAYIEGARDGRSVMQALRDITPAKPVVVWKAGRTGAGAEAASSHTGSMMASAEMWSGALKQSGAIEVRSMEELADTLLLFQQLGSVRGRRIAVVCGLTDGGGGESVLSGDACASNGLDVPRFPASTREKLAGIFGEIGSVLRNPLDVSQGYGDTGKLRQGLEVVLSDDTFDVVAIYENVDILLRFLSREIMDEMNSIFMEFARGRRRAMVVVLPPGSAEDSRLQVQKTLLGAGLAVFPTVDRAARAIANVYHYTAWKSGLATAGR